MCRWAYPATHIVRNWLTVVNGVLSQIFVKEQDRDLSSSRISTRVSKTSKTILQVLVVSLLFASRAFTQQFDAHAEQQLVQLINQERARAGLPSLEVEDRLTQAAREHSALMVQAKQLSHQVGDEPKLSQRLAATGLHFNNDAENVAYDQNVEGAHIGLMHSPGHRENILSPLYNTVGVGVVRSGEVLWVTEDFANRMPEYSADEAESTIIAAWQRERRRANNPPTAVTRVPQLRRMACAMGKRGELDTRSPLGLPEVRSAAAYTQSDPATLPSNAVKKAHDPSVRRIGVGACFADGPRFPAGVWWVLMAFH